MLGHGGGERWEDEALGLEWDPEAIVKERKEKKENKRRAKEHEVKTSLEIPCWFGELKAGAAADMIRYGIEI